MNRFKCEYCGSEKLAYNKYVKCIIPVEIKEDGHIEYGLSPTDEDNYSATHNGFICSDCGSFIDHRGFKMETEQELLNYLTMDPEVREQQQKEYGEQLAAMIDAQEEQENVEIFDVFQKK